MNRFVKIGLGVFALTLMLGLVATVHAQGLSGTLVGDTGGAYQTWNVNLPANKDVSLSVQYWPCGMGDAISLDAWSAAGMLGTSWEKDACTETLSFNTGAGGATEIKLSNYAHGVGTWWTLMAEGIELPGMAAAKAPAAAPVTAATTTTSAAPAMVTTATTTTAAAAAPAPAAPAAPAPAAGMISADGTVLGNNGGAYADHNLTVQEGKKYTVKMTAGTEPGGNWNGQGFHVWGPNGLITDATMTGMNVYEATFTADGNVVYLVQPYNYNHGVMMWYHLESMNADS